MYLIDANVLITSNEQYYPLDRIPQFWEWLIKMGEAGEIKMPREIYDEVSKKDDCPVTIWARHANTKRALILEEEAVPKSVQHVLSCGYNSNDPKFTDIEQNNIMNDALLIAYAFGNTSRVIITKEVSKPSQTLSETRIPDACEKCAIEWHDDFWMYKELNFNLS